MGFLKKIFFIEFFLLLFPIYLTAVGCESIMVCDDRCPFQCIASGQKCEVRQFSVERTGFRLYCREEWKSPCSFNFGFCQNCPEGYDLIKCESCGFLGLSSQTLCEKKFYTSLSENPSCYPGEEVERNLLIFRTRRIGYCCYAPITFLSSNQSGALIDSSCNIPGGQFKSSGISVSFEREFSLFEINQTLPNGTVVTSYKSIFSLIVRNTGNKTINRIIVREIIPEEVAANESEIDFGKKPRRILRGSVVVEWIFENVSAGGSASVNYSVNKKLSRDVLNKYGEPNVVEYDLAKEGEKPLSLVSTPISLASKQEGINLFLVVGVFILVCVIAFILIKRRK